MKTAEEWIDENSQSGALDLINSTSDAVELIEAIQKDARDDTFTDTSVQQEYKILKDINEILQHKIDTQYEELASMRQKWLDARKHLRAANKGAERNAVALQLAASRINSMNDPIKAKLWEWLVISNDEMRLRMGEISSQEIRNIRACLRAILGTKDLSPKTNQ